jgi:hypothetical protein
MKKSLMIALFLVIGIGSSGWSADPANLMGQAGSRYSAGEYVQSINLLRQAVQEIWNQAPLAVQNVHFITDPPDGYGMYTPKNSDVFNGVDPILIYCEPLGYTVNKKGDEYHFSLSADFAVLSEDGQMLGGQQDFGKWEMASRTFNSEFMMFFTFNLSGLESGTYKIQVTLKDKNANKTVQFESPFKIE